MAGFNNDVRFYVIKGGYVYYSYHTHEGEAAGSTGVKTKTTIEGLDKTDRATLELIKKSVDEYAGGCKRVREKTTIEDVKSLIAEVLNKKPRKQGLTVGDVVDRFIEGAEATPPKILTENGMVYSFNSVESVRKLQSILKLPGFTIGSTDIARLTPDCFYKFKTQMIGHVSVRTKRGLSKNTVANYYNYLLTVIKATHRHKLHKTDIDKLGIKTEGSEEVEYPIYYSVEELKVLMSFEGLTDTEKDVRDTFIVGCFTGLRMSDAEEIDFTLAIKNDTIHVQPQKTSRQKAGKMVAIPMHPYVHEILKRRGYKLRSVGTSYFDRIIKRVCKKAGFKELCLFSRTVSGRPFTEYREKYKLTGSHTMRRSFATNAQLLGVPPWAVKKIGGWKSDNSFMKYLRMAQNEANKAATDSDFYKLGR